MAAVAALAVGAAVGFGYKQFGGKSKAAALDGKIDEKLAQARQKVEELRRQTEEETRKMRQDTEKDVDQRRAQIVEMEKLVAERESKLTSKLDKVEAKEAELTQAKEALKKREEELAALRAEEEKRMAEISGLTGEQAGERVLALAEERTKEEIVRRVRKMEKEGERQLEEKARNIMANVIQRYASSHVAETSTSYVDVPDQTMIGRIIGKEGRNIQQLERVTGCEIVIDETPNSIMISGFSPIRRQVAKKAIERLMKDGRIHPGRIEEVVEEAKQEINEDIREAGEACVYDLGIVDFPEKLVHLVGRMKYRTSYRQNILNHSWEAARIAMMLAEELGADVNIAKKATLLHDIGKAIDHEVEGNHVEIGEKIMRKFNIDERIVRAAAAHHEDYPFDTREAIIVQVSDAISAARPGARRDSLENYVKRMQDLENVANTFPGIEKSYAISAGREIRVFVKPEELDDLSAIKLDRDVATKIESTLQYPGTVKVNIIRETRAVEFAK